MNARAALVCFLTALTAALALCAPPALAAWRPVDYLYECEDSKDYSKYIVVIVPEKIGNVVVPVEYTVGSVSSCTTDGRVSLCADCYAIVRVNGETLSYNFVVDGLATLDA